MDFLGGGDLEHLGLAVATAQVTECPERVTPLLSTAPHGPVSHTVFLQPTASSC